MGRTRSPRGFNEEKAEGSCDSNSRVGVVRATVESAAVDHRKLRRFCRVMTLEDAKKGTKKQSTREALPVGNSAGDQGFAAGARVRLGVVRKEAVQVVTGQLEKWSYGTKRSLGITMENGSSTRGYTQIYTDSWHRAQMFIVIYCK